MEITKTQKEILQNPGPLVVAGSFGTGKTYLIAQKIAMLIKNGTKPFEIIVVCFTYRQMLFLKQEISKFMDKEIVDKINIATFRDLAEKSLSNAKIKTLPIAQYRDFKRVLTQAVQESGFAGTTSEAEHVIRQFKSKAAKPNENERFFSLLQTYQSLMGGAGYIDRFDLIRINLINITKKAARPVDSHYLFVDEIQDATELQLLWLLEYIEHGTVVFAFGNPQISSYMEYGAEGENAFKFLTDENIRLITLNNNFETSSKLGTAIVKFLPKNNIISAVGFDRTTVKGQVILHKFKSTLEEFKGISKQISGILEKQKRAKIAIYTRTDVQSTAISDFLEKEDIKHGILAAGVFDSAAAVVIMDALELLLNIANTEKLRNVLVSLGLKSRIVDFLITSGLNYKNFFADYAFIPENITMDETEQQLYENVANRILSYYNLMKVKKVNPRNAFKALAYDLIHNMTKKDKAEALVALDMLLSIKGKLSDVLPKLMKRKEPNINTQVLISTIGDSRGATADYVFIPFCSTDNYPISAQFTVGFVEKNEKMLFATAVSRAKKGLFLTCSDPYNISKYAQELDANMQQE